METPWPVGIFLFTSSMYICIRGRTVIYHKVMLWLILSKINLCFLSLWKISLLEPSWKVWSIKASNTSNLPCFSLDFLISCGMNCKVMANHLAMLGKCLSSVSFWALCHFSIITISLQRSHEQVLYWYRSEVPQFVDATAKMNCSRQIQVKRGFNPWIIQYFFSFTTVFLILYLSMLRNDPIVYIGNEC